MDLENYSLAPTLAVYDSDTDDPLARFKGGNLHRRSSAEPISKRAGILVPDARRWQMLHNATPVPSSDEHN